MKYPRVVEKSGFGLPQRLRYNKDEEEKLRKNGWESLIDVMKKSKPEYSFRLFQENLEEEEKE